MAAGGSSVTTPSEIGGDRKIAKDARLSDGTLQTLVALTTASQKTNTIFQVVVDARVTGECTIYHGADMIGSFRTGPSHPTGSYLFAVPWKIPDGENLFVDFEAVTALPVATLRTFVQYTES